MTTTYTRDYFQGICGGEARIYYLKDGKLGNPKFGFSLDELPKPMDIKEIVEIKDNAPHPDVSLVVLGEGKSIGVKLKHPWPVVKNRQGGNIPIKGVLDPKPTTKQFPGSYHDMVSWDKEGDIIYAGIWPLPTEEPEIRINVRDYRPLRNHDVAHAFREAFDWFAVSSAVVSEKPATSEGQAIGGFGIMGDLIKNFVESDAREIKASIERILSAGDMDRKSVAEAASIVASLGVFDEALSTHRRRLADSKLVGLICGILEVGGVDGNDRVRRLVDWSQAQMQKVDDHVRVHVRERNLFSAYDRLADALEQNMSNQLRAR